MPKYGAVGTPVTFYVSSPFPIEGDYRILWSTTSTYDEGKFTVIKSGTLPKGSTMISVPFNVPEATYGGPYFVQFFQPTRDPINDQFRVTPGIYVIPTAGRPGSTIVVKGSGFPANDSGTISMKNNVVSIPFTANALGSFSAQVTIPDLDLGYHQVVASSNRLASEILSTNFEIISRSSPPPANPSPETPPPSNNQSNNTNISSIPIAPPISKVKLPKPVIISPRNESIGWIGRQSITFKWGTLSGFNGITYNLEVGDNFNFTPPLPNMQKNKLTGTAYVLQLPPGTYYWRVKAVDNQGNEGEWALSPYPFKVSDFPVVPIVVAVALIAILSALITMIQNYSRRDRDYYF